MLALAEDVPVPLKINAGAGSVAEPGWLPALCPAWMEGDASPLDQACNTAAACGLCAGVVLRHNFRIVRDKAFNTFACIYANVLKLMQIAIYRFFFYNIGGMSEAERHWTVFSLSCIFSRTFVHSERKCLKLHFMFTSYRLESLNTKRG